MAENNNSENDMDNNQNRGILDDLDHQSEVETNSDIVMLNQVEEENRNGIDPRMN